MIYLIFDKNALKILTMFAISPGSKFVRRDIKEKVMLNNVSLDDALAKVMKSGVLKKEKRLYSINFYNSDAKEILKLVSEQYQHLKEIPLKVYFLLLDFITSIKPAKIEAYLFGSYAKLIYKENSDVDIAILDKEVKQYNISKLARKLEKKYNFKIELHTFDKSDFYKNKKDPLIQDILKNGIKLF